MKLIFRLSSILVTSVLYTSCTQGDPSGGLVHIMSQRDSLFEVTRQQGERLELFTKAINTLNQAVDSISEQEGIFYMSIGEVDGSFSRTNAINNLDKYELVLRRQHEKIQELKSGLKLNESGENLIGMVSVMQEQLKQKDAMIAQLRSQLNAKDVNIARLRRTISIQQGEIERQNHDIDLMGRKIKAKDKALLTQDQMLNECYVLISTKKDLQQRGIIRKNHLSADALADKSKLRRIDIRKAKEFAFTARRPHILTNMPTSSYVLTTSGDGNFILTITNPGEFWSLSNVLIIQTD